MLSIMTICFFCNPILSANAENLRGIQINAKSTSGIPKTISLYNQGRHALIIGAGDYRDGWPHLPNPVRDARDVASMLKQRGWNVDLLADPEAKDLNSALNRLVAGPGRSEDRAIMVWFSGHGYTFEEADGSQLGYIVPVDAPDPDRDLAGFMDKAVSMRKIQTIANQIRSRHVLMVFDSCFSGAIFQLVRAKPSPYIEEKIKYPVREFITAGAQNEQVPDRSVFKDIFIQAIADGFGDRNGDQYITGEELGAYLQESVINYSRKTQHPQFGKINNPKLDKGDFVFPITVSEARLYVTGNVADAAVLIDGRVCGTLPLDGFTLSPGKHRIRVEKNGYSPYETQINLQTNQSLTLKATLSAQYTKPVVKDALPKTGLKSTFDPATQRPAEQKNDIKKRYDRTDNSDAASSPEEERIRNDKKKVFVPLPSF